MKTNEISREKMEWLSIRGAITAGVTAGMLFGINFTIQALVFILKYPGASGFLTGLTVPLLLALASQTTKERGTATVAWTLYSILAIGTQLMGPPGPYKVVLGFMGGLAYDTGYSLLKGRSWGLYISLLLYLIVLNTGFFITAKLGLFPEMADKNIYLMLGIINAVFIPEGIFSTWIAIRLYHKVILKFTD